MAYLDWDHKRGQLGGTLPNGSRSISSERPFVEGSAVTYTR
jgi:hypothetical protein